jgi:hypothetical protein
MAKITGDFGSSQKANGVVELLSPLAMVWRRPLEWGGTSSLGSDGVSVTFTNTNLPKEGEIVYVYTDGTAKAAVDLAAADTKAASLCLVWTGYEQHDSGAIDTFTTIEGNYFLYDVSDARVNAHVDTPIPTAGALVYWAADEKVYTSLASTGSDHYHSVGTCESTRTAGGTTYYRIKWSR